MRADPAARPGRRHEQGQAAAQREQDGEEPNRPAGRDVRPISQTSSPGARIMDKTGAERQSERLYAPLVPPGRGPLLYVRNHCYASTRSDSR
jgi:hypothetical protein